MASRRFVDRGFWKCPELNQCDARTRLLAVYLFSEECDDFGRIKDDPYRMRHGAFPDGDGGAELDDSEMARMVDALVTSGFLVRYRARDDRSLFWIRTFHDYQPMKYWAQSRLDRHPDDDFEAYDTKTVKGKKIRISRPLAPMGHVKANCDNSPQPATTRDNLRRVASPIPIPIPIPTPIPTPVAVPVPSIQARRGSQRLTANDVPSHRMEGTATRYVKAPEGVSDRDWQRLLGFTLDWPLAGRAGGIARLGKILAAGGPRDAEGWVAKACNAWERGELRVGPWAVLGKGWEPSDGNGGHDAENDAADRGGDPAAIGDVLAKGIDSS